MYNKLKLNKKNERKTNKIDVHGTQSAACKVVYIVEVDSKLIWRSFD